MINNRSTQVFDQAATRFLARVAFRQRAIDLITFDFIYDEPERAMECSEFCDWLATPQSAAA
jgi:hypothetical protein